MRLRSTIGIGHTRWATHGEPNDVNAHRTIPTAENWPSFTTASLKIKLVEKELLKKGHEFLSETDTEVLIHFIEDIWKIIIAHWMRLQVCPYQSSWCLCYCYHVER